jgi:hypothetical protein
MIDLSSKYPAACGAGFFILQSFASANGCNSLRVVFKPIAQRLCVGDAVEIFGDGVKHFIGRGLHNE